jgi:hypothetical protein
MQAPQESARSSNAVAAPARRAAPRGGGAVTRTQPSKTLRRHERETFRKNRKLQALIRSFGDVFLFATAADVVPETVYRWALGAPPQPKQVSRVNALARARSLPEPFQILDQCRFRERGKAGAIVRALIRSNGGIMAFARAVGTSDVTVRTWACKRDVYPTKPRRDRINALAREAGLDEPFPEGRPVRFPGRGPLPDLVRAYGGVANLARAAGAGETSVSRWINEGKLPFRHVALRVNQLARERGLAAPFDADACVRSTPRKKHNVNAETVGSAT